MHDAHLSLDRRVNPRVTTQIPVKFRLENNKKVLKSIEDWRKAEKNVHTFGVSLEGMSIDVEQPLKVGQILQFEVALPDRAKPLTLYAEVRWAEEHAAGLRFVLINTEDIEALKIHLGKVLK